MELETQLAEYRARKRRGLLVKKVKNSVSGLFTWASSSSENGMDEQSIINVGGDSPNHYLSPSISEESIVTEDTASVLSNDSNDCSNLCDWSKFFLYVTLWFSLFGLAVFAEFGAVFVILSGFVLIWLNTRTGPKRPGEISAYSVFNPNCEAIDGTLDAKQLEKELLYGGM